MLRCASCIALMALLSVAHAQATFTCIDQNGKVNRHATVCGGATIRPEKNHDSAIVLLSPGAVQMMRENSKKIRQQQHTYAHQASADELSGSRGGQEAQSTRGK